MNPRNVVAGASLAAVSALSFACTAILGNFDVAGGAASPLGDAGGSDAANAPDGPSSTTPDASGDGGGKRLQGAKSVTAGTRHSCALTATSEVYCWGDNSEGQLGLPASTPRSGRPVKIGSLPANLTSIVAGEFHTCALGAGDLYCWGRNKLGQLGAGDTQTPSPPRKVLPPAAEPTVQWTAVGPGTEHTCAVESGGATYCWGDNSGLQAGEIGSGPATKPLNAGAVDKASAGAIAAAKSYTCITGPDPAVRCWGTETNGELGNGDPPNGDGAGVASAALLGSKASAVAAGGAHTCAIDANQAILCWGDDAFGQLGFRVDGGTATTSPSTPVPGGHVTTAIAAGGGFTCFIAADGALRCFGSNQSGELGQGGPADSSPHPVPDNVIRPDGAGVPVRATSVGAGADHACAVLDTTSDVICWGKGADGQLGDGSVGGAPRTTPVFVVAP